MDLDFNEEQEILRRAVRDFIAREAPREKIRQWDKEGYYPKEIFDKMAALGWYGLPFPAEYGGSDLDTVSFAIMAEEISRCEYDVALAYGLTIFNALNLLHHGTKEQKDYYIPRVIKGEQRFSVSMSEPDAGSDVASLKTSARREGDFFVIDGQKMFSSGAAQPNNTIKLAARTDPDLPRHKGLTMFLLDADTPGVELRAVPTLGRHILKTYSVYLDNVRVPVQNVVGEVNGGWKVLLSGLELERMFAAMICVGTAQTVVDDAVQYAKIRVQFGQPIGKFQAIAHMLADMQTAVDAARLLAYRAAFVVSKGRPALKEVSMAKLFASETLVRVTNDGMQIVGGYGYTMESDMQRYFRDARITTVAGGSSQIQRDLIARQLGL